MPIMVASDGFASPGVDKGVYCITVCLLEQVVNMPVCVPMCEVSYHQSQVLDDKCVFG